MTNPDLLPEDELRAFKKGEPDLAAVYTATPIKKEKPVCGLTGDGRSVPTNSKDEPGVETSPKGAD